MRLNCCLTILHVSILAVLLVHLEAYSKSLLFYIHPSIRGGRCYVVFCLSAVYVCFAVLKDLKTQKVFNVITNTANRLDRPKDSTTQREISTRKWFNVH